MPKQKPIIIVQGAQWGSEAKGMVAAHLTLERKVDYAVRTGAVNAGHTVMWDGWAQKMQQLPTGWVRPGTKLVLGAGTFVHPTILAKEIELVNTLTGEDVRERLLIDYRASLHLEEHTEQAKLENRHHAIGATGKGCSVAITDKIRYRGKGYKLFKEWWEEQSGSKMRLDNPLWQLAGIKFADTVEELHNAYDAGDQILLEGTQGSLLDLNLGPYPYTTHKPCQAMEWAMEAGLALGMEYEVAMVARTYPIRVAGNSGPMRGETTWPNIARTINRKLMLLRQGQRVKSFALQEYEKIMFELATQTSWADQLPMDNSGQPRVDMHKWTPAQRVTHRVALSEFPKAVWDNCGKTVQEELANLFEMTTVTKKLRRVAEFQAEDVKWACRVNRASYVVLTFFNYWFPELWGVDPVHSGTWKAQYEQCLQVTEQAIGAPIKYITTGPNTEDMFKRIPNWGG